MLGSARPLLQALQHATTEMQRWLMEDYGFDERGASLNVNADTAAMAVAQAMGAEKLIYMSDVNGVRTRKDDPGSLIHSLTASQARERSGHTSMTSATPSP